MGAGLAGPAECSRVATTGSGGFVLRNPCGRGSRNVGSRKRLRVHSQRRVVRPDAFLAGITGRAHFLPPAHGFRPSERASHALAAGRLGIDTWAGAGHRRHSENLVGLAGQPAQRGNDAAHSQRGLRFPESLGQSCSCRALVGGSQPSPYEGRVASLGIQDIV